MGPIHLEINRICNKYNSAEGYKFGDKCHFAHGEWELGKPLAQTHDDPRAMGPGPGRMGNWMKPHAARPTSSFGASSTAKISVDVADHGGELGAGAGEPSPVPRVLLKLEEDVQNDVVGELREQGSGHRISNLSEK
ncbi:hypothetical protein ACFX13_007838 [Malus domestica]|uniref:zinc finger CCCH domain-containing protein 14-like n=1 Tax=Malus sylvestris TaxID=3752 RepID=UPI0021AC066D|nr:zinc finger CCCH domain-containing protein 14-like [Malus sylvestris]